MARALLKEYDEFELADELGDKAYCLVDTDVDPAKNAQLAEADSIVKGKAEMIVSSPCFEVWLLCHYGKSGRAYASSEAAVKELRKKFPTYEKGMKDLYSKIESLTVEAVNNAKSLEANCLRAGRKPHTVEFSPSTEVYKIIEEFQRRKERKKKEKQN